MDTKKAWEVANTRMLACHTTTDPIIYFPTDCRFPIMVQTREAPTAPDPKANNNNPNPLESTPNSFLANIGTSVV